MVNRQSCQACIAGILAAFTFTAAAAKRPFTVDDSIALTRTIDAGAYHFAGLAADFPLSPDGTKFLVVTSRGDIASGFNRYELTMYDVDLVRRYVASRAGGQLPGGEVLTVFETPNHEPGIGDVQWIENGKAILFVGRRTDSRVYRLPLESRRLEPLTAREVDAVTATLSDDGKRLVYTVRVSDYESPSRTGYVLDAQKIASHYATSSEPSNFVKKMAYFVRDLPTGEDRPLSVQQSWFPRRAWISPDSRHAVLAVARRRAPAGWWSRFAPMRNWQERFGGVAEEWLKQYEEGNLAFGDSAAYSEFVLVDLDKGSSQRIMDAPISEPQHSLPTRMVGWRNDSREVVLSGTCVTLPSAPTAEPGLCQQVVAFDLDSGKLNVIGQQDVAVQGQAVSLMGVDLENPTEPRVLYRRKEALENAIRIKEPHRVDYAVTYRLKEGNWVKYDVIAQKQATRLHLKIRQGLNEPWQLEAFDTGSGRSRVFTNWNPQLKELELGTLEIAEWQAERGETVRAGLVKPPGFDPKRRYPLVIQTYGFDEYEFLVDGADRKRTMFSARALAAKGMLVLQLPIPSTGAARTFESFLLNREWLRSAVKSFDDRGLIDPERVGLLGFSYTGQQTWDAITFGDIPLAAAIVADSAPVTVNTMSDSYGVRVPGMQSWEQLIGARYWGSGIATWQKRSPVFHLDRIRAPLLLERYGYWPMADWECYTLLKRERRPVELIHRPGGRHAMGDVTTTRLAQHSAVDWFSFWLQDSEDPDPAKVDQYVRWRKLRRERDALPPPPPKWTTELPTSARVPSRP